MTDIDWSKAPEGATHAVTTGPKWDGGKDMVGVVEFAKLAGGDYHRVCGHGGWFCIGDNGWVVVAERPSGWTGEGLPPVGARCEYFDGGEWMPCEVVAHRNNAAVVLSDCYEADFVPRQELRPIRSPEQIAAEERRAAILEMKGHLSFSDYREAERHCATLYEAGYRKVTP
jgi:hypothetical protein